MIVVGKALVDNVHDITDFLSSFTAKKLWNTAVWQKRSLGHHKQDTHLPRH